MGGIFGKKKKADKAGKTEPDKTDPKPAKGSKQPTEAPAEEPAATTKSDGTGKKKGGSKQKPSQEEPTQTNTKRKSDSGSEASVDDNVDLADAIVSAQKRVRKITPSCFDFLAFACSSGRTRQPAHF